MACTNVCRLCPRFILSQSVSFTGGNLIINLPAGAYNAEEILYRSRSGNTDSDDNHRSRVHHNWRRHYVISAD